MWCVVPVACADCDHQEFSFILRRHPLENRLQSLMKEYLKTSRLLTPSRSRRAPVALTHWTPRTPRASFCPSRRPSFLHRFFTDFLDLFLADVPSQLGSPNLPNSIKNRCQDAFHLGLHFWIDVWSICAPNLDPQILKNQSTASAKARF